MITVLRYLRHLVVHDFWLKLFSFVLAFLIWLAVSFAVKNAASPAAPLTMTLAERTFPGLPVVIMSSAEDVRSVKVMPSEVEVTVQGDPKTLSQLVPRDIHAIVDLTGIQAAHDLRKRIEVSTPAGVTHKRVDPLEVQVIFPSQERK